MRYLVLVMTCALVGCASGPSRPARPLSEKYDRQIWARVPVEQAEAECYAFINTAAGAGQNLYLCMKGKGFVERP